MGTNATTICISAPAPSSPSNPPFGHFLWKGICDFFDGLFRPKVNEDVEKLKRQLITEKARTTFLKKELLRIEEVHIDELEEMGFSFDIKIEAKDQCIIDTIENCSATIEHVFNVHEVVKGEEAVLRIRNRELQNIEAQLTREFASWRQSNAALSDSNKQISAQNSELLQQDYQNQKIISAYHQYRACFRSK